MTVLLTFGDARYEPALRRIEREAARSGFFDRLSVRRPSDLGRKFWRKHGRFVAANRRGYGCWLWKPWIVHEELAACRPGEMLVYADSGCTINERGRKRFDEYRKLLDESPTGVLGFQMPFVERCYTKGDAFQALDAWRLKDTRQVMTTVMLWRRAPESMALAREWLTLAERYDLISDSPSVVPSDPSFVAHRRDQSLFSLLAKLRGATLIDDETCFADWDEAGALPFWATRRRGGRVGPIARLLRDLSVSWQRLRHVF
jgi:hypothetical protein